MLSSHTTLMKKLIEKGQGEETQPLLTSDVLEEEWASQDVSELINPQKEEIKEAEESPSFNTQTIPEEKQEEKILPLSFSKPDLLLEINACIAILENSKKNNITHKNDQRKKYNTILLLGFLGVAFSFGEIGLSLALMLVVMNIMHARLVPSLEKQLNKKTAEKLDTLNRLEIAKNNYADLERQYDAEEDTWWDPFYLGGPKTDDNCFRWRNAEGYLETIWDYFPEFDDEFDRCWFQKNNRIHPRPECEISAEKICALQNNGTIIHEQMDALNEQLYDVNLQIDDLNDAIAHPKPETITTIIFVITTVAFLTLTGVIGYKMYQRRKQHIDNLNRTPEIDEGVNQYENGVRIVNLLSRLKIDPKTFKAMTTDQLIARLITEKEKIKKKFAFFSGLLDAKADNNYLLEHDAGADVSRRIMDFAFSPPKPT